VIFFAGEESSPVDVQAPNMAARLKLALYIFTAISIFTKYFKSIFGDSYSGDIPGPIVKGRFEKPDGFTEILPLTSICPRIKFTRRPAARLRIGIFALSKHRYTPLSASDLEPVLDLTIYKDISNNLGPEDNRAKNFHKSAIVNPNLQGRCIGTGSHVSYSRSTLLSLRVKSKQHCYCYMIGLVR